MATAFWPFSSLPVLRLFAQPSDVVQVAAKRPLKLSVIGPPIAPSTLKVLKELYSACAWAVKVSVGLALTRLIAPPLVLRPYSVPCGPLSTSTRSRSKVWKVWLDGELR